MYKTLLLCCCCLFGLVLEGQNYEPETYSREQAREDIVALKQGWLIVRLPTFRKKLEVINKRLADPDTNLATKGRLIKTKKEIKAERDTIRRNLRLTFNKHYRFSKLAFIDDSCTLKLKYGDTAGCLRDKWHELDPNIKIGDQPFYFARYGETSYETTTGVYAIVLTDRNFKDLGKPFPYYSRAELEEQEGIMKRVRKIFGKKRHDPAQKLNRKLFQFYNIVINSEG